MADQTQLLQGKTAAITGGLTGIGKAILIGFLQHGCSVAINYLGGAADEELLTVLKTELPNNGTRFLSVAGDISNPETGKQLVAAAVREWNKLDIFVSNAGVCKFAEFLELEPDLYSHTVRTNLDGAFYATQAAARQMASQSPPGGSIIGISSISALVGGGLQTHYTPTKAGILSLMQSCAVALGKYGIRCNALLPGTIETQLNEEDLKNEEKRRYMEGRIPLGRTGEPQDMVGPAVFLAGDLSRYVSGAQILVDGGLFCNLQ
ncbi:L-rhamnose-1-dehydrogenase [Lignoscripta atroalba]|nr:L-rhamnose-1-dehydrogenase [Lignoscripta atroalba]